MNKFKYVIVNNEPYIHVEVISISSVAENHSKSVPIINYEYTTKPNESVYKSIVVESKDEHPIPRIDLVNAIHFEVIRTIIGKNEIENTDLNKFEFRYDTGLTANSSLYYCGRRVGTFKMLDTHFMFKYWFAPYCDLKTIDFEIKNEKLKKIIEDEIRCRGFYDSDIIDLLKVTKLHSIEEIQKLIEKLGYFTEIHNTTYSDINNVEFGYDTNIIAYKLEIPLEDIKKWIDEQCDADICITTYTELYNKFKTDDTDLIKSIINRCGYSINIVKLIDSDKSIIELVQLIRL